MEATNVGTTRCPFGGGAHPYLTVGSDTVDEDALTVPADTFLVANERQIPVESKPVEGTQYDFREARPIGDMILDTCYTGLSREGDGRASVRLEGTGGNVAQLWMDEHFQFVMVFSGDTVHPESRRRQGLAVEPMTCAPNAFNSGEGLLVLEPGETFRGAWGIATG
jgi:aldose 1-epimerase